jgi:rfaE bifunctional protein kinase chain/domain
MVCHNGFINSKAINLPLKLSKHTIERFSQQKIVIIGDLVADQFLRGTIARVSREAPVFILSHDETETLAGGAANAAVNVASLGAQSVLTGFVGADATGDALLNVLKAANVNSDFVIPSEKLKTTTKVRVIAGQHYAARQQVIRIDYENKEKIPDELSSQLKKNILEAAENAGAIVISDYNYGAASIEIAELARRISKEKNIPMLVDSRFHLKNFQGATSATPNQDEVEQILGKNYTENDCVDLRAELGFEALLVTRGNLGMMLIEKGKNPVYLEAIGAKEPIDVTGAGDTVIAAYALGLASGLTFAEAAEIANHAGGIVVMKKGTASITTDELLSSFEKLS